jgi:hypothetical protein
MKTPIPVLNLAVTALVATLLSGGVIAQTAAPVQSSARPFGLPLAGQVMVGGSDTASANFQANVLPSINTMLNSQLSEYVAINDSSLLLDPNKLFLKNASDVRVYFVGEGAGYHNTLGYNTGGGGVTTGDPQIIFPDASSRVTSYNPGSGAVARTAAEPLLPGDFVNLGTLAAGSKLDFFLIANGAQNGRTVFSTDRSVNPDGINHVVTFAAITSTHLIIGFEDLLGGGDRDFNDLLFAVDIGSVNIAALTANPEPALWLTLGSFLGASLWLQRRRSRSTSAA